MDTLADLDLDQSTDPATRQVLARPRNLIEDLHAEIERSRAENQQLRDKNARLKGGSARPTIRPQPPRPAPGDVSSERERHGKTPRQSRRTVAELTIHQTVSRVVDPALLPADAECTGYEDVIVRDLRLTPQTTCFPTETWYAPSTGRTSLAPLPPGDHGPFGPGITALVVSLASVGELSQPTLLAFPRGLGRNAQRRSAGGLAGPRGRARPCRGSGGDGGRAGQQAVAASR